MTAFDERAPYNLVVVELREQAGLFVVCNFRGDSEQLRCGLQVQMGLEDHGTFVLPQAFPFDAHGVEEEDGPRPLSSDAA
jgi:hypothetical protein